MGTPSRLKVESEPSCYEVCPCLRVDFYCSLLLPHNCEILLPNCEARVVIVIPCKPGLPSKPVLAWRSSSILTIMSSSWDGFRLGQEESAPTDLRKLDMLSQHSTILFRTVSFRIVPFRKKHQLCSCACVLNRFLCSQ